MSSNLSTAEILRSRAEVRTLVGERWMRRLQLASAGMFVAVLLLSSMYCLLAYIPATYFAFIQAPFLGWMPAFAALQPLLFAITFCLIVGSSFTTFQSSSQRRLALLIL